MSEDKFEQSEPKDEDVEAHTPVRGAPVRGANEEPSSDDEVEAHSPVRGAPVRGTPVRGANDEAGSDDEVEAHHHRAQPHRA